MVLHHAFRARHVRKNGIVSEVRHGVASVVSCEPSLNKDVSTHLHRECRTKQITSMQLECPTRRREHMVGVNVVLA